MRAVIQRVIRAEVVVDDVIVGAVGRGYLLLVAVMEHDTGADASVLAQKVADLRIFADDDDKMNRSLLDTNGEVLVVSQFTLAGDVRKGRRPSFTRAARPATAAPIVEELVSGFESLGIRTASGVFGAQMQVSLVNDGPVTFIIDVENGSVV